MSAPRRGSRGQTAKNAATETTPAFEIALPDSTSSCGPASRFMPVFGFTRDHCGLIAVPVIRGRLLEHARGHSRRGGGQQDRGDDGERRAHRPAGQRPASVEARDPRLGPVCDPVAEDVGRACGACAARRRRASPTPTSSTVAVFTSCDRADLALLARLLPSLGCGPLGAVLSRLRPSPPTLRACGRPARPLLMASPSHVVRNGSEARSRRSPRGSSPAARREHVQLRRGARDEAQRRVDDEQRDQRRRGDLEAEHEHLREAAARVGRR